MNAIEPTQIINALRWRYATKVFDPKAKIPAETWAALEETLVLTPSSYGLHPWKAYIITDPDLRQELLPHAWGQRQVVDASHLIVFAAQQKVTEEDVDRFISRIVEVRGGTADALTAYKDIMIGDLVNGPRSQWANHWAAHQAYIALGQFMANAALLGIDASPMEGFVPSEFDRILGLPPRGLSSVVLCAAGYRSADDRYAALPKVRHHAADIIEHR